MKLIFLVEERSMKYVLEGVLPQIMPKDIQYQVIPHEGKSSLEKSIPIKLKAWREPNVRFVIVHDQDSNDCVCLKKHLNELASPSRKEYLIRIVCRELEAWYFGDLQAVENAYGIDLRKIKGKSKYRKPDDIVSPKSELRKIIPMHQQIAGAKKIAQCMDVDRNISESFKVFVDGVRRICQ